MPTSQPTRAQNLLLTAILTLAGTGLLGLMTHPLWPKNLHPTHSPTTIEQRWPDPDPVLPKADRLAPFRLTSADPTGPTAALTPQPTKEPTPPPPTNPGGPIEQALERKNEDAAGERAAQEHHREARRRHPEDDDRPTDTCARHGLRKVYTHHGRSWRCR